LKKKNVFNSNPGKACHACRVRP